MKGKNLYLVFLLISASILMTTPLAFGAGFSLYEESARGNALGGAMTARADDPSALYYNPAGITQLPKTQTAIGMSVINPRMDVQTTGTIGYTALPGVLFPGGVNPAPALLQMPISTGSAQTTNHMDDNYYYVPNLYVTQQLTEKTWVGVGVFSRFGLGVEFPTDWAGRFNSYNAQIKTTEINPNVAVKLADNFSVSAGLSAMYFNLTLQSKIAGQLVPTAILQNTGAVSAATLATYGTNEIDQRMTGDSWGYGYNFGLLYKPYDFLSLGATFRSEVRQNVTGTVEFTNTTAAQQAYLPGSVDANGKITLPSSLNFGINVKPIKNLSVEFDAFLTNWSSYSQLSLNLAQPVLGSYSSTSAKNWKDVWSYRVGVEYNATDWMDVRLSYIYDESPVPDGTIDYLLPDNDRNIFGGGLGFHKYNFTLDFSFNYLIINDRDIAARPADGILASHVSGGKAYIYGMELGYKF